MQSTPRPSALVAVLALALVAAGFGPSHARAKDAPPLTAFIDVIRGYDVTTIRRTIPDYNTGLFEMVFGAGPGIPLSTPEQEALFTDHIVTAPSGQALDVGHVITGLEAATAPTPMSRQVEQLTGCTMLAGVTWSGDVGTALHDFLVHGGQGDPSYYFAREAPPEDLLGDVDGWVLGAELAGGPVDVAATLQGAYLGGDLEAARFHRFAASLGGMRKGGLSDEAQARIVREVGCFAVALATLFHSGVAPDTIAAAAPSFAGRFIVYVENGLAAEGG